MGFSHNVLEYDLVPQTFFVRNQTKRRRVNIPISYLWLRLRYSVSAKANSRLLLHSGFSYLWLRLRYSVSAESNLRLLLRSTFRIFVPLTPKNNCNDES